MDTVGDFGLLHLANERITVFGEHGVLRVSARVAWGDFLQQNLLSVRCSSVVNREKMVVFLRVLLSNGEFLG